LDILLPFFSQIIFFGAMASTKKKKRKALVDNGSWIGAPKML